MNKDRLYDNIRNIKETISLLDKALITFNNVDEDMKELISASIKQCFLEYFILIENFTSLCLKDLKLYKISDDMEKSLKKLKENKIIDEKLFVFLNQYRKYRNRIAHVYKQPSIEEVIDFINDNKHFMKKIIRIMDGIYTKY